MCIAQPSRRPDPASRPTASVNAPSRVSLLVRVSLSRIRLSAIIPSCPYAVMQLSRYALTQLSRYPLIPFCQHNCLPLSQLREMLHKVATIGGSTTACSSCRENPTTLYIIVGRNPHMLARWLGRPIYGICANFAYIDGGVAVLHIVVSEVCACRRVGLFCV